MEICLASLIWVCFEGTLRERLVTYCFCQSHLYVKEKNQKETINIC